MTRTRFTLAAFAALFALAAPQAGLAYDIPIELQRELERVKNLVSAPASAEATPKTYDRAAESMRLYYTTNYRGNFDDFSESGKPSDRTE